MADEVKTELIDGIPAEVSKEFDRILGQRSDNAPRKGRNIDEAYLPDTETEQEEMDVAELEGRTEEKITQETPAEKVSEPAGDEDKYEDIPDFVVEAARAHGLTDEEIVKAAETNPKLLDALSATYQEFRNMAERVRGAPPTQEVAQAIREPVQTPQTKLDKVTLPDMSEFDPETATIMKALADQNSKLVDAVSSLQEELGGFKKAGEINKQQEVLNYSVKVDGFFDRAGLQQLGQTNVLNQVQRQTRKDVHDMALVLGRSTTSATLEESLSKAVKAYKVMHDISEVQDPKKAEVDLVKKLQTRKQKFSPRPGGHKTTPSFKTEDERVMDVMGRKAEELGLKFTG